MSIPASQIVSVTPRVISAGGNDLEISGLFITENALTAFPTVTAYTSAKDVATHYGSESEEYKAAVKYFLGYDNSFKKPKAVYFARAVKTAIAGAVIGGAAASLATLKTITDGAFTITVDGTEKKVTGLNFRDVSTQSDIAETLETAIGGVDVVYNATISGFVITSKTTGANSVVSFGDGETATALGISEEGGAVASEGSDALTPRALMESITAHATNWVTFTTIYEADAEEALGFAQWSNDQTVDYLYCGWTTKTADTLPTNSKNLPNTLAELDLEGVCLTYGGLYYGILPMAIAGSIDWNRVNGLPTFKFKAQSGLAASVSDSTVANNLISEKVNYYGRYATRADDFVLYAEGRMLGGNYDFIDTFIGMVWLKNKIQLALVNGLTMAGRVPYNDAGYTMIKAWFADPINAAKLNGVIQSGVSLSESQRAELINEIGADKSQQIYSDGYYLEVSDPSAQVRANRETPVIGLWYTYGGAVHKMDVPLTLVK